MTSKIRQNLKVLWLILSPGDFGPLKLMIILSLYSLTLLLATRFLSVSRNGAYELSKQRWIIIGVCAILIEVLNQFTYWYAKFNRKIAIIAKGVFFWLVFTCGIGTYIYLLGALEQNATWQWHKQIGHILVYLVLAWVLPIYSLSPNIRFLLLWGRFKKK